MKFGTRMKDFADEVPCKLLFRKEGYFLFIDEADCKRTTPPCEGSGGLYRILGLDKGIPEVKDMDGLPKISEVSLNE